MAYVDFMHYYKHLHNDGVWCKYMHPAVGHYYCFAWNEL